MDEKRLYEEQKREDETRKLELSFWRAQLSLDEERAKLLERS
jgi:hypothetical protein